MRWEEQSNRAYDFEDAADVNRRTLAMADKAA
jgi:hypothetical protein